MLVIEGNLSILILKKSNLDVELSIDDSIKLNTGC